MANWNITSFHDDYKCWLLRDKGYRKEVYRDLEAAIDLPTTSPRKPSQPLTGAQYRLLSIAEALNWVGLWKRHVGASAVFDGDPDGWRHLRCGLDAACWNVRTARALLLGRFIKRGPVPLIAALCFGQAVAMRCDGWADWLGAAMLEDALALKRPLSMTTRSAVGTHLLRLYCTWRQREADWAAVRRTHPGVYRFLWTHWHQPAKFAAAIGKACDYHCEENPNPDKDLGDFEDAPFNVFPVEILAVQRVRRELDLPWPEIDHPLLATPLAHIPSRKIPECDDPLIRKACRILKAEVPALERALAHGERS